ncbi:MAG: restriction endonuclease subunit S [Oscillibacter sp.]|nr:restriction endonuclease subunit S [Oscillibacter sp.]
MSWNKVTLGEISSNIQTGPFGSQLHQSDYSGEGTPVVMPKDLVNGHISEVSIARVSEDHVSRLSRHKIEVGDILYSRRGDVGRCAFATDVEQGWLCGTGCLRVTVDKSKVIPKFVFYQLQKAETVGWVEKHAVGATMLNLNTSILSSVPIEIPFIEEQQKIVDTLSAYDDLIENNQKQIKLLEEAAQRLYKEWFVDLRFPGHETTHITDGIPKGWSNRSLSEVFDFVRGKSYTSKELSDTTGVLMANLKNIRAFGGYNRNAEKRFTGKFKDNQNLTAGDIVMGVTDMTQERRLVGHVALVPDMGEEMTFSMDLIKIIPKMTDKLFVYSTLYYGGLSKQISPLANGVNVLHLKPEAMMGIEMLIPCDEIVAQYHQQVAPIITRIEALQKQCDISTEARDRLLPKLMSGEIEV